MTLSALLPVPSRFGVALSLRPTAFGPVLFAGRLEEGIETAARSGFGALELSVRRVEDVNVRGLDSLLVRQTLQVAAIATGQAFIHDGLSLAAETEAVRSQTVAHLAKITDLAAQFGSPVILGGIRGRLAGTPGERQDQRAGAVEAMRRVAGYATDRGVRLLVEPINRYETNFVNTAAEGLALIDEVGDPSIQLLMDTFHMNIEENDMCGVLRDLGGRLGYFHVADSNRRAPGWGHMDFPSLFRTLEGIAYRGRITAEILPLPDDASAMRQAGGYLTSVNHWAPTQAA